MSEKTLRLIKRVYPYKYMDSFEKLSDRCEFFCSLKDKFIEYEMREKTK